MPERITQSFWITAPGVGEIQSHRLTLFLLPAFAAAGAATDYSFALFKRATLKQTVVAAALAAASRKRAEVPVVEQLARNFFAGNDHLGVTPTTLPLARYRFLADANSLRYLRTPSPARS
jgi:hypothetical protein